MIPETTDQARELFSSSGMTYKDITRENLQKLRNIVDLKMKESGCFKNTFRCKQRPFYHDGDRICAGIRCKSFYFNDREAITFNPDGFIGFAGWADSKNIKPILAGFAEWLADEKRTKQKKDITDFNKAGGRLPQQVLPCSIAGT